MAVIVFRIYGHFGDICFKEYIHCTGETDSQLKVQLLLVFREGQKASL